MAQVLGAAPMVSPRQVLFLPLFVGLLLAVAFLPFLWVFLRESGQLGRGAIVVFFVPLVAGPLFVLGFQRPAFSLLLAVALGLLDWRLGGRFGLSDDVLGITTNPSNIFFVMLFLQSFFWRSCRRVSRLFLVYVAVVFVGAALGMFVTADLDKSMAAFIMRLVIPAGIAVNAIRSLTSPKDLELIWQGVIAVAVCAALYNTMVGFSGERGFGRGALGGNAFSISCACLMPVAVEWGLSHPLMLQRWMGRVASIVFIAQVWLQAGRAAIAITALYLAVRTILGFRRVLFSPFYVTLVVLVLFAGGHRYARSRLVESGGQRQAQRFKGFLETGFKGSSRWDVWGEAVEVISDSPVLGCGINAFTEASWLGFYAHPHQVLLAMWLDTGPLGMAVFLVLMMYLVMATLRRASRAPPGTIRAVCAAATAMVLMLFGTLQIASYLYCGPYFLGTWVFHLVVVSAFVSIALADEHGGNGLQEWRGRARGTV